MAQWSKRLTQLGQEAAGSTPYVATNPDLAQSCFWQLRHPGQLLTAFPASVLTPPATPLKHDLTPIATGHKADPLHPSSSSESFDSRPLFRLAVGIFTRSLSVLVTRAGRPPSSLDRAQVEVEPNHIPPVAYSFRMSCL
ncbi:hypothetical protein AGABI1DRAFT_128772 [Agaricus bisporus var. burnettii JB137-S8]|uniref:Uncharacterized protein n=1 Tax=Agaricus bisporus var. burnettii (strain JB137-S8 / ATCC MYA-4627 / FGSC 10392) TaxID=597362 RepID=K5VYT1_AGABU|nr:uncharacterized protein AGABI1DRAFT_128772 [Agaricus bisporus var. burnettii JB137-S8]EKM79629.1 hypothetical protein AGABI1DRAFT_128772 [Agaricus bisporus var. burnettii JB137-S8]